jgi:AbrB family looped-hinge helix DNA binding protein
VQEKGQVTVPAGIRRQLGLKKGDLVSVSQTEDGVLTTPQAAVAIRVLDRIGEALREQGVTLDELIESARTERGEIVRELYSIDVSDS